MPAPSTSPPRARLRGKTAILCLSGPEEAAEIQNLLEAEEAVVIAAVREGHSAARLALERHPDLVIMAGRMPDGIGGVEAAELILPQFQTCVIVLGWVDAGARSRGYRVGVSGFVRTPLANEELINAIDVALSSFRCSVLDQIH